LCRAHPNAWPDVAKAPELLARLPAALEAAPDVVFPGSRLATLLARPELHDWIMTTVPPRRVLSTLEPFMDGVIAKTLDSGSVASNQFLDGLPRGRALTPAHKATLHRLAKSCGDSKARKLFEVTFDTPAFDFSRGELEALWTTLERVPHAHVDQRSIKVFRGMDTSPANGTAGIFWGDTRTIDLQKGNAGRLTAEEYDHQVDMTEAEAIEAVGSKEALADLLARGVLERDSDGKTFHFHRRDDKMDLFTHTILHEVGHSVDQMLGSKTELIYGLAGWRRFAQTDFDAFAQELGGWEQVSDADKKEIRKAWTSWLRGGQRGTVSDMVASDHPVVSPRYANVGVVQLATKTLYYEQHLIAGKYVIAKHASQELYTLSQKAFNSSPSGYALTAPEEYFAECYANYYIDYDGTPATADKKGATLAPWFKNWFDTNIDRVGHNPKR